MNKRRNNDCSNSKEQSKDQRKAEATHLPLVHEVREKMGILIDKHIDALTCEERLRLALDLGELVGVLEDCQTGDCP
jgi:Ethanolamine utilization protein EutJ (predicted chaperonin)